MVTIIPVRHLIGGNCFNVSPGELKRVYDTNSDGVLMSVKFEQDGQAVYLPFTPAGKVYYQYRK